MKGCPGDEFILYYGVLHTSMNLNFEIRLIPSIRLRTCSTPQVAFMKEPLPSDPEDFERELEVLRSIIRQNIQRLDQDPMLDSQLDFWMESARFLMTSMEVWEDAGDRYQYTQAVEQMQKILGILQDLIDPLSNETGGEEKA